LHTENDDILIENRLPKKCVKFKKLCFDRRIATKWNFSTKVDHVATEPRVFVLYGYHPTEKFAIDVGIELSKKKLENVITKQYDGEWERPGADRRFQFTLKRYLRDHLPFDYAIDLHDAGPIMEKILKTEFVPSVWISYSTRTKYPNSFLFPNEMVNHIAEYFNERKEWHKITTTWEPLRNMSRKYDRVSVEFYPHLISKEDGVKVLVELIQVLQTT